MMAKDQDISGQALPQVTGWDYRLSNGDGPVGERIGTATLEIGSDLTVVHLRSQADDDLGLVFGFLIDLREKTCVESGTIVLDVAAGVNTAAVFDAVYARFGGRFIWITAVSGNTTLHLDSCGQIPCVYDPERGLAGSSAAILLSPRDYDARFDHDVRRQLGLDGSGWFPGGLTAHRGILRLLPNHALSMDDMTVARSWTPDPALQLSPDEAVSIIIDTVQTHMTALRTGSAKVAQALTAGRETRMLLGCAKTFKDDFDFVTLGGENHLTADEVLAKRIARDHALTHRILPIVRADPETREAYLRRNGHCVSDANSWLHPSVAVLAKDHVFLGGLGGEIGRGFLWRSTDTAETKLTGSALMDRFGFPSITEVNDRLDAWVGQIDGADALTILELAYLEHRMGAWFGAQFPSDQTLVRYAPLMTRRTVIAMLALPPDWKREQKWCDMIIERTWPSLSAYPYNSLGRWRDGIAKIRKIVAEPGLVIRKLRQRFL